MEEAGEIYCPRCKLEKSNVELQKEQQRKYEKAHLMEKYNLLKTESLIEDETLLEATFHNYKTDEPETEKNLTIMKGAMRRIISGEKVTPFLQGDPGAGKSHLSYGALIALNEHFKPNVDEYLSIPIEERHKANTGVSCLFVNMETLSRKIRNSYNDKTAKHTESYCIDLLSKVDFLVLDDLGAETGNIGTDKKASDFIARILYAISTARQGKNKINIITTNLSSDDLFRIYDRKALSRLMRNPEFVVFNETSDKRIGDMPF
jgi:DNA replication protein DnaC